MEKKIKNKIKEREKCGPKIIIAIIHDAAVVVVG